MLLKILFVVVCFLLCTLSAVAQEDAAWSVWMWNETSQEFMRVDEDGSRLIVPLQLPYGYSTPASLTNQYYFPSFTRDGRFVAFCARVGWDSTVFVYDLFYGTQVAAFPFTYAQSCHVIFDDTGTRLAVGLVWWPNPTWVMSFRSRVVVLEFATGRLLGELFPGRQPPVTPEWHPFEAYPIRFEGDTVLLHDLPYEGKIDGWMWNITRWELDEIENYHAPSSLLEADYLSATGERIELAVDEMLEYYTIYGLGGGPQPNVINVMESDGSNPVPVLYSPTSDILALTFIDDGRKIALYTSSRYVESGAWRLYLDRNSNLVYFPEAIVLELRSENNLYGTGDGLITFQESEAGHLLVHYRFEGDNLVRNIVWQEDSADEDWKVIWVTPLEGEPGLRPLAELEMITLESP